MELIDREMLRMGATRLVIDGVDYYPARDIDKAPVIDAVPVVRCKSCIKWEADGVYEFDVDGTKRLWGVCSNSLHHCKDNHYCSYGERRKNDELD